MGCVPLHRRGVGPGADHVAVPRGRVEARLCPEASVQKQHGEADHRAEEEPRLQEEPAHRLTCRIQEVQVTLYLRGSPKQEGERPGHRVVSAERQVPPGA